MWVTTSKQMLETLRQQSSEVITAVMRCTSYHKVTHNTNADTKTISLYQMQMDGISFKHSESPLPTTENYIVCSHTLHNTGELQTLSMQDRWRIFRQTLEEEEDKMKERTNNKKENGGKGWKSRSLGEERYVRGCRRKHAGGEI